MLQAEYLILCQQTDLKFSKSLPHSIPAFLGKYLKDVFSLQICYSAGDIRICREQPSGTAAPVNRNLIIYGE